MCPTPDKPDPQGSQPDASNPWHRVDEQLDTAPEEPISPERLGRILAATNEACGIYRQEPSQSGGDGVQTDVAHEQPETEAGATAAKIADRDQQPPHPPPGQSPPGPRPDPGRLGRRPWPWGGRFKGRSAFTAGILGVALLSGVLLSSRRCLSRRPHQIPNPPMNHVPHGNTAEIPHATLTRNRHDAVTLTGQLAQPWASGWLAWDQGTRRWRLRTAGMRPSAAGRAYQVWIAYGDHEPIWAGVFTVGTSQRVTEVTLHQPPRPGSPTAVMVTEEPFGHQHRPGGPIQLMGAP